MIFAAVSSRSRSLSFLKGLGISWYPKSHNKNHVMKTKEMSRGEKEETINCFRAHGKNSKGLE
jgi:hypothetical protein